MFPLLTTKAETRSLGVAPWTRILSLSALPAPLCRHPPTALAKQGPVFTATLLGPHTASVSDGPWKTLGQTPNLLSLILHRDDGKRKYSSNCESFSQTRGSSMLPFKKTTRPQCLG